MHICNNNSVDMTAGKHFIYIITVGSFLLLLSTYRGSLLRENKG